LEETGVSCLLSFVKQSFMSDAASSVAIARISPNQIPGNGKLTKLLYACMQKRLCHCSSSATSACVRRRFSDDKKQTTGLRMCRRLDLVVGQKFFFFSFLPGLLRVCR
jgi:hypothetical protein